MAPLPSRDSRRASPFARAAGAYRATLAVGPRRHLLDAREQPARPAPPAPDATPQPPAPAAGTQRHRLEAPGWTAFRVGAGFTAGVLTVRLVVQIIVTAVVLLLVLKLFGMLGLSLR